MASRCRNGSAVCSPAGEARELGENVKLLAVFFPLLQVFTDHPPSVVEYLGKVFVGAKELGDVRLEKLFVIVLLQPAAQA